MQDIKRYLIPKYFDTETPNVSAAARYFTKKGDINFDAS